MILALDPSSTCTGFATLDDGGGLVLDQCGTIRPAEADLPGRLLEIANDVRGLVCTLSPGSSVVIERPQTAGGPNRGGFARMGVMSACSYGAAFGVALATVAEAIPSDRIITPTPAEWVGRGLVPSSRGDPHKVRRVRWVESLYLLAPDTLGPRTYAGNVADAILMARWARGVVAMRRTA